MASVLFSAARAEDAEPVVAESSHEWHGIISVSVENDLFYGEDNNYTSGFRAAFLSEDDDVPDWLRHTINSLPFFAIDSHKRWGVSVGQSLFTPDDIRLRPPNPNDEPYAAWLYGGLSVIADTGTTLDTLQVELGVVGPSALGGQTQDFVHSVINSPDPQGWDYQLKDEPGIIITYERKWRNIYEFTPFGWGVDITPSLGGSIGNVDTHASVGAVARFGYDLPADYGPPLISPALSGTDFFDANRSLGWYLFAGVEGRAVARNIFLDGNTWKDSPSVDKIPFIGGLQGGLAITYHQMRLAYTQVIRTPQFEHQKSNETYGAVTFSYHF